MKNMTLFLVAVAFIALARCQSCTDGDVRLASGINEMEGRVEVCIGGTWGTVTDDGWNSKDGRVVCRQLGFSDIYVLPWDNAHFGPGSGKPILMDNVACSGTEATLTSCPFTTPVGDNHNEDAGVDCFPIDPPTGGACTTGQVRLADGDNPQEGRVEICFGDLWGTLADDGWGSLDSKVLCKQLGFVPDFGLPTHNARPFGQGTGHIWMDNMLCAGTEETIFHCPYDGARFDGHNEDAGVVCYNQINYTSCTLGELRLVNGPDNLNGRIEICLGGVWGTLVDDGWSTNDARTACRQLGHSSIGAVSCGNACYGQGTGPLLIKNIACNGREARIIDCGGMSGDTFFDHHGEDAGLRCNPRVCTEGEIRLENGTIAAEGRAEICFNGVWSSICDKGWSNNDAKIVCGQLGYGTENAFAYFDSYFGGNPTLPYYLDDINCGGTESNILDCVYSQFIQSTTCRPDLDDAGVRCAAGSQCTTGDVRLLDGTNVYEGRLEVCIAGLWGTVVDDAFDVHDAAVVCKQLGFYPYSGIVLGGAFFGQGNGIIHMDTVRCVGNEGQLTDCQYAIPSNSDTHSEDVGVRCYANDGCTHGMVRLMGGTTVYEGRVEVCLEGVWSTVSSDRFGTVDAKVVCKQLGYYDDLAIPFRNAFYGQGTGPVGMDNVLCTGDETLFTNCSFAVPAYDPHSEDAGVKCFAGLGGPPCSNGDLRVSNGLEGLLEVCFEGQWGSICDTEWTNNDANTACNQLGHAAAGATAVLGGVYPQSSGPIWFQRIYCAGNESKLTDCSIEGDTSSCTHARDAGIVCIPRECEDGNITLVGGNTLEEGRVEFCRRGLWGTICNDQWGVNDAKVVCHQLGYSDETVFAYTQPAYGTGTGRIWLNNVECQGDENSLSDCSYAAENTGCTHVQDVSAKCFMGGDCTHGELRLIGNDDCDEGLVEVCLNGHWGSIANDGWGLEEANVVCRQLGFFEKTGLVADGSMFASGSGPILMAKLMCNGDETQLVDCDYEGDTSSYTHDKDAGVKCFKTNACTTGDLRLNGGTSDSGRLEVCISGEWGTVADTSFSDNDVTVACRQLGFTSGVAVPNTYFGCSRIYLHSVTCNGDEDSLLNCTLDADTSEDTHAQDVALNCTERVPTNPPATTPAATRPTESSPTMTRATASSALSMTTAIAAGAVVGVVLLVIIVVLVIVVMIVYFRGGTRDDIAVAKRNINVNAAFPDDSGSVATADVSNPVYTDPELDGTVETSDKF